MLRTNPEPPFAPPDSLAACIHACIECAQVCTACADACIGAHDGGRLDHCIRICLDCADVCEMAGRILSRQQSPDLSLIALVVELTAAVTESAAAECSRHSMHHPHCHVAAATAQRCFEACRQLASGRQVH